MSEPKRACEGRTITITAADLPLSCPMPGERVWDAHPRVYLAIESQGNKGITCPYCGTHYVLDSSS